MITGAVITADIVNSTLLSPRLEKRLRQGITDVLQPARFEFYRGDSFQALVRDPREALLLVLQTRMIARRLSEAFDLRASIGIGKVNPGTHRLSTAREEAFVYSGRAFDTLPGTGSRLIIQAKNEIANHGLRVIAYFADYLFASLTVKQAEVFFALSTGKTQQEAARSLKKSQSTIHKHVQAGGWPELVRIIKEYEGLVAKL